MPQHQPTKTTERQIAEAIAEAIRAGRQPNKTHADLIEQVLTEQLEKLDAHITSRIDT